MDPTGGLSLQKKSFHKKKDIKATTTQGEIGKTKDFTEPYQSRAAYDEELFPIGSPKVEDVNQENIGNCFLLAALLAMIDNPNGRLFLHGVMKDIGPDDDTKPTGDANPAWVIVRLYDHTHVGGGAKYIKVKKCTQVDNEGNSVFQRGPLWVHMLVAAGAQFDRFGFYQEQASFENVEGGNANIVFSMLSGTKGPIHEILDFSTVSGRKDIEGDHGVNIRILSHNLKDASLAGPSATPTVVLKKVFDGNTQNRDAYVDWLNTTRRSFGSRPEPRGKLLEALINREQKTLRREHVETLFNDNSPNAGTAAVLNWIDANSVLPGKRFTKKYTPYDLSVFQFIHQNFYLGRPVCIGTRLVLSSPKPKKGPSNPTETGASGEIKVKGLASGHAYAVLDVEKDEQGECWITIRNPWGSYGRSYSNDGKAVANSGENSAVSRITLGDVVKCFKPISVGLFKLKG